MAITLIYGKTYRNNTKLYEKYQRTKTLKGSLTLGRYADNLEWASESGTRAKSRKAESTGTFSFLLNAIVRRIARTILRTSLVYEPVSMSDAISFNSTSQITRKQMNKKS